MTAAGTASVSAATGATHTSGTARRLMARLTAGLEDATMLAVTGQSAGLTASQHAANGRRIAAALRDLETLARAAEIVAKEGG